jgi:hypothetical protein
MSGDEWRRRYFSTASGKRLAKFGLIEAPQPERESNAMREIRVETSREKERAQRRAEARQADQRRLAERFALDRRRNDAEARWRAMSSEARERLADLVRDFGPMAVIDLWRRHVDADFDLPQHLRGAEPTTKEEA